MSLTSDQIIANSRSLLAQVPFRTTFERENFLFNSLSGPRLLVALCQDIENLNEVYTGSPSAIERTAVLEEMNIISAKIAELTQEIVTDVRTALENAEAEFWVETLARKAATEALAQQFTFANMEQMLQMPAELYEETIVKCQSFLKRLPMRRSAEN